MQKAISLLKEKIKDRIPQAHVVLGSGFGHALSNISTEEWRPFTEIAFSGVPGMPASTVSDHAGKFCFFEHRSSGHLICFQMGRLHGYEGYKPADVVLPVTLAHELGVQNFILTNAAGGLGKKMRPGDVMLISDHINLTGQNPLVGPNPKLNAGSEAGPRFPDMSEIYSAEWRLSLKNHFKKSTLAVHEGWYLGVLGPSFETPAEISVFSQWGVSAVGMSTVWEAIALKHRGVRLAGISLISNLAAGLGSEKLEHEQIVHTSRASAKSILDVVCRFLASDILK